MSADRPLKLMLLPGLLNDAALWRHQSQALAPLADISVPDLTVADDMRALAAAVLAQTPPQPFALAGLSMGGYVALEILRQAPQRVAALALLDTSAHPDTPEAAENRRRMIALAQRDFAQVAPALMQAALYPPHLHESAIAGVIEEMARRVGPDAYIRQQRAILSRADSRPLLERITQPTLVLCGRQDRIAPPALHEEMVRAIPGATLTLVEHCGHLSALEQPEAVSAAMHSWLASLDAG